MKRKSRKVRVTRTGTRLIFAGLLSLSLASCNATSTITVKQSQDGKQVQDVEIKHEGSLNSLALSLVF